MTSDVEEKLVPEIYLARHSPPPDSKFCITCQKCYLSNFLRRKLLLFLLPPSQLNIHSYAAACLMCPLNLYRSLAACESKHKVLLECYKISWVGGCKTEMENFWKCVNDHKVNNCFIKTGRPMFTLHSMHILMQGLYKHPYY